MTPVEAAARLGVHETMVTAIVEHAAGWLVSLRPVGHQSTGAVWLVTDQVARVYVPEVDDPAPEKPKRARKAVPGV